MAISYITTTRNSMLANITTAIGSSGRLRIYNGTIPASANAALSGNTELVNLPLSATFAPAPLNGVLTANAITSAAAASTGTATFFRLTTSANVVVVQGTVGNTASAQDLRLDSTSLVASVSVSVSSLTITEGNP